MSTVSLLVWLEKGTRTRAQATKSGRDDRDEWFECWMRGWFVETSDGSLNLTDTGRAELSEARVAIGG